MRPGNRPPGSAVRAGDDTIIGALQGAAHGEGHDYSVGSPHIRHFDVHRLVTETLVSVLGEVLDRGRGCRVLEVGAGHGTFTDHVVAVGASVVVTEMSAASVDVLRHRYRHNDRVDVVHDPDGTAAAAVGDIDAVACISVLHHIPDYLSAVREWTRQLRPGGAFVSFQDPLWYPRRSRLSLLGDRAAYLSWRLGRGTLVEGARNTLRRRHRFDENEPSDMVEYHVLRDGVDELALTDALEPDFQHVDVHRYWSSQGGPAQTVGARVCPPNTFGIVARDRRRTDADAR